MYKKDNTGNAASCSCISSKYLASIISNSVITCDEIIEETKTVPTKFQWRKIQPVKQKIYILLAFSLITIVLLTAVSIYCYLEKYKSKEKQ